MQGKRITIGPPGSGTHYLALKLLAESGVTAENSTLLSLSEAEAVKQLTEGTVDAGLCRQIIREELEKTRAMVGEKRFFNGRYQEAAEMFREMIEAPVFPEFLTLPAYDWIVAHEDK